MEPSDATGPDARRRIPRSAWVTLGVIALGLIVYVGAYLALSHTETTPFEEHPGHYWTTRNFTQRWHMKLFKPLIAIEDVMRDGDFSWELDHRPDRSSP